MKVSPQLRQLGAFIVYDMNKDTFMATFWCLPPIFIRDLR